MVSEGLLRTIEGFCMVLSLDQEQFVESSRHRKERHSLLSK